MFLCGLYAYFILGSIPTSFSSQVVPGIVSAGGATVK